MTSAVGPLPRFAEVHVRRALELIAEHKTIGRKQLAKKLGVGEGSMRTILNQLKKQSLITSSRGGHTLTAKGRRSLGKPLEYVQVDASDLTVGEVDVATIVRRAATKVKRGIEQRDEAIKAGADGATVLIFKAGKLQFPDGFAKADTKKVEKLIEALRPRDGDVIIIGTGRDAATAEAGARAAARTLCESCL
jgi:DNA-binding PadR family transcriptional regulator